MRCRAWLWSFLPVYEGDKANTFVLTKNPVAMPDHEGAPAEGHPKYQIAMPSLYRTDGNWTEQTMYEAMEILRKDPRKMDTVPGQFLMDVVRFPARPPTSLVRPRLRVNPMLAAMKEAPMELDAAGEPSAQMITRVIQSFWKPHVPVPHLSYTNLLYIYPRQVSFVNRPLKGSCRNIIMQVIFKDNDLNVTDMGLPRAWRVCRNDADAAHFRPAPDLTTIPTLPAPNTQVFFGRAPGIRHECCYWSHAQYHQPSPTFHEEIKMELPVVLTPKHHLLFVFYHVACKREANEETLNKIGYAHMPLLQNGLLNPCGTLRVAVKYDQQYTLEEPPNCPKVYCDHGKPVFQVDTRLVSSVTPSDAPLATFLRTYKSATDEQIKAAMQALVADRPSRNSEASCEMVNFMPSLLNALFHVLCLRGPEVQPVAFNALLQVVTRIRSVQPDPSSLQQYLDHFWGTIYKVETSLCVSAVIIYLDHFWGTIYKVETSLSPVIFIVIFIVILVRFWCDFGVFDCVSAVFIGGGIWTTSGAPSTRWTSGDHIWTTFGGCVPRCTFFNWVSAVIILGGTWTTSGVPSTRWRQYLDHFWGTIYKVETNGTPELFLYITNSSSKPHPPKHHVFDCVSAAIYRQQYLDHFRGTIYKVETMVHPGETRFPAIPAQLLADQRRIVQTAYQTLLTNWVPLIEQTGAAEAAIPEVPASGTLMRAFDRPPSLTIPSTPASAGTPADPSTPPGDKTTTPSPPGSQGEASADAHPTPAVPAAPATPAQPATISAGTTSLRRFGSLRPVRPPALPTPTFEHLQLAWFLFNASIKSMTLKIHTTRELADETTRPARFGPEFYEIAQRMVHAIAHLIDVNSTGSPRGLSPDSSPIPARCPFLTRSQHDTDNLHPVTLHNFFPSFPNPQCGGVIGLALAMELNRVVAMWLCDLWSIADRGKVAELAFIYLREIPCLNENKQSWTVRLDFLRFIAEYEHWIPLNLPPTRQEEDRHHPNPWEPKLASMLSGIGDGLKTKQTEERNTGRKREMKG
ncbi:putative DOCK family protein [Paratrimastix pyriformis]|uniref:DOCK family protein n=1 Tax=Paratrimastix pyriformis TaxID=342808 RepID=A0ABQ8UEL1_9EUKA|nr:putative DOCK family protein [Paratrimastix pyriformis]